jgi:regulator of RNase E activity RraA
VTGKWRIQTVAINRPVSIAGIPVRPGDLVVADEVGVCFIPFDRAVEVLAVAQRLTKREDDRLAKLDSGLPLKDWIKL